MKREMLLIPAIFAIVIAVIRVDAKEWRGITPLHSTRSDVERLLGKMSDASGSWAVYQTDKEAISVLFASGPPCGSNANNEWRVARGTVISVTVSPKSIVLFSRLNLDESKYTKLRDPHKLNRVEYRNEVEGESISVVDDEVSSFTYFAAGKDSGLHCPPSRTQSEPAQGNYFRLDEYGNLMFQDEKIRLDNLAIVLQQQTGSRGYIIGYPASRSSQSHTIARLNRAIRYLVNIRGIDAKRLRRIRGGPRQRFIIELFVVPRGVEAPIPFPQHP